MDKELAASVDELQKVADYRKARRLLRSFGWPSLIIGIVNGALGYFVLTLEEPIFAGVLILVGLMQVGIGIFNLTSPVAEGVILDGFSFLAIACLNVIFFAMGAGRDPDSVKSIMYGVIALGYSIYRFVSYPKFHRELSHKPEPEDMQRMDRMVAELQKATTKNSPDVIEFQMKMFQGQFPWKGRLAAGAALLAQVTHGHEVFMVFKDQFEIKVKGKAFLSKNLKVNFVIRGETREGVIGPESLDRYELWKDGESLVPEPYPEDEPLD